MAGHVQDRWFREETDADDRKIRVRTNRHGIGLRYRARFTGPDGSEQSKSFPDRQKRQAEVWLANIEADMSQGRYIDPRLGRTTFGQYAEKWLAAQTTDLNTQTSVAVQIRKHAIPDLGRRPMDSFRPEHIREWLTNLESRIPATSYRRVIFSNVSAVFAAAVDDGLLPKNPCTARSVSGPSRAGGRLVPWTAAQVFTVKRGLPERFRAMVDVGGGCGLRQGEIFGLPLESIDFSAGWIHVANQVKLINGRLVFAPPKRGKERDVPLPGSVASALKTHLNLFPPIPISLPWLRPDGKSTTKTLIFYSNRSTAVRGTDFNVQSWKPALVEAGFIPAPGAGERFAAAREHGMHALRHFYASVLLDAGENIKALSQYLGHNDPGFTLRVYTHLMPSSDGRTRQAMDRIYEQNLPHGETP